MKDTAPRQESRRTGGTRRAIVGTAIGAVLALTMTACSAGGSTSGQSSSNTSSAASGKSITIGYSTYTLENPAFAGIVQGIKGLAQSYGYQVDVTNSNNSLSQQITDIEGLIAKGVSDIIITPANGEAMTPAIEACKKAHIPVFALADRILPASSLTATYSMSHEEGGKLAGEQIVKALTKKYGTPKGNVVDLEGIPGLVATNGREKGFEEALKPYPNIKVVAKANGGFDTPTSNKVMTAILQAHPHIDAVYGANDASTFGAIQAIKTAGRFAKVGQPGHIYAIGIDGSAPGIDGVRDGSQDATVSQEFIKMGNELMKNIHLKAEGKIKKIPSVNWPLMVITAQNINSAKVKKYGIWADDVKSQG